MKEEKNKTNRPLSDFQRYVRGEMTKRQENAFQRKLQRDPFAAEAAEGYSEISADEADGDIERLGKRLKKRVAGGKRKLYYRIAASIAVLMIISSVYLLIDRNKPESELSKNVISPSKKEVVDAPKPAEPVMQVTETVAESNDVRSEQEKSDAVSITVAAETVAQETLAFAEKKDTSVIVTAGQIAMAEKDDSAVIIAADQAAEPAAPVSDAVSAEKRAETKNARPVAAEAAKTAFREKVYTLPVPVTGKENFDRFLSENIRVPVTLQSGDSVSVELMITVNATGKIDRVRILSSPGKEFSNEAERLISEGPAWFPATSDGTQIVDSIKLVIPFRK